MASVSQGQERKDNRNPCPAGTGPARAGNGKVPGASEQVQPYITCISPEGLRDHIKASPHIPLPQSGRRAGCEKLELGHKSAGHG